jgi:NAD(P)-dependent dehydrogenase (short-subunit alcohol dehydrogenase family)
MGNTPTYTSAEDVVASINKHDNSSFKGRYCVITGSNTGIGKELARVLVQKAHVNVIMICRNKEKMEAAANEIRTPDGGSIDCFECDLSSLKSVRACCDQLVQKYNKIDLLVLNAGIAAPTNDLQYSEDGFELHLASNHFGHFALTLRLLPLMESAQDPRIIAISSVIHKMASIDLDDLHFKSGRSYISFMGYAQSKLANILFTNALHRKLASNESTKHITVNALHPGTVQSDLLQRDNVIVRGYYAIARPFCKTVEQGAICPVYVALAPNLNAKCGMSGKYFVDSLVEEEPATLARDETLADKLWDLSEQLTGEKYPFQ